MQHLLGETAHGKMQRTITRASADADDESRQAQSAQPEKRKEVISQTA